MSDLEGGRETKKEKEKKREREACRNAKRMGAAST